MSSATITTDEALRVAFVKVRDDLKAKGTVNLTWTTGVRSLTQNGLFWLWMGELAGSFSKRSGEVYTKEQMHDLMCLKFLGELKYTVGKTEIARMKSLRDLDKGEMHYLMEQVDAWAAEHGVSLTDPADSEYRKLIEAQNR